MLTCLKGRRDALESMLHGDAWARIPWDRAHISQAQWVQQQIRDAEFWQRVHYAILVMSPVHQLLPRMDRAERNWAEHERVTTARRCKLGLAKLAQLVEIATNLKLASCARQGGGYMLPWVMGSGRGGTVAEEEDEEGDVEPKVWGARPDGSVPEQEIHRQIVAFRDSRPSRARSVRDVFNSRATELRPWPKGGDDVDAAAADDDIDDDWTDDDDTPLSHDPTAERVYFTYGGGRDGTDSFTSVIAGVVPSTALTSGSSRAGGGHGGRSHVEVRVGDSEEQQPRGGLRHTGRRWEVRSDSKAEGEAEDEEVHLRDRRFSPSHHPISAQPEGQPLRRSERLASAAGRDRTHDGEDHWGERTPSDAGIRPRSTSVLRTQDFEDIGLGGSLADLSVEGRRRASPQDVRTDADVERGPRDSKTGGEGSRDVDDSSVLEEAVQGEFDYEGQDDAEGVPEGQDVVMGGGSPSGDRGNSETAGDEGQGAATCDRGEGGPGGDSDTAGAGGDNGPDGDDDDDHGSEDDPDRLALVLRDPTVPPMDGRPHAWFVTSRDEEDIGPRGPKDIRGQAAGRAVHIGRGGVVDASRDETTAWLSEVEARLAAGVVAGQAALNAIQRERERGIAAQAEEDEDADTESEPIETAAHRHRAQVAAAAAAAHAAYVSGARGIGTGGRGGCMGGSHGRAHSGGRGHARSGGR
ncbi:hypothetical protein CBR_g88558 [Chara braunii]|uniref:Uncharacterized protein n=1 Tax=Chara braunii TaxID=69332 RepID=A0A388KB60_CHABU|nr:hypothetical protein CBR_g88558 [Chara braunii]|eukprot:GBG67269.1 hypothetical protein CBR_g88558 [Chara braunii]